MKKGKCHAPLQEEKRERLGNYKLVSLITVSGKYKEQATPGNHIQAQEEEDWKKVGGFEQPTLIYLGKLMPNQPDCIEETGLVDEGELQVLWFLILVSFQN